MPVLIEVFDLIGLAKGPAVALAVGTAQANILIASLTAASAHWRAGTIDGALVRAWLPALLAGAGLGLWLGAVAPASWLTALFAASASALALKLAAGDRLVIARRCRKARSARCRLPLLAPSPPPSVSAAEH